MAAQMYKRGSSSIQFGTEGSARGRRGRAAPSIIGSGRSAVEGIQLGGSAPAHAHVRTVGVRRPGYGTAGRPMQVYVNACEVSLPPYIIHHYDDILGDKTFPPRFNLQLIKQLQLRPEFQPAGAYDGKKNLFMPQEINLGPRNSAEFDIALARNGHSTRDRPPRVYRIRITKVATINPESLQRFIEGRQSLDEESLTVITALNVIVRMDPMMTYPFNTRSFFTDTETRAVGHGLELWRGYFQSVRPTLGRMLINIDISTGIFFKSGPLINLALDFFNQRDPRVLSPRSGFSDRQRAPLQRFISGIRVEVQGAAPGSPTRVVVIQRLSGQSARDINFTLRDGRTSSVADYFRQQSNRPLNHPDLICALTASGAAIPLERCTVVPGQIARKQVPPEVARDMVEFSTKRPSERLQSIRNGITVFGYGQSEYVRNFGMNVNTGTFPITTEVRVLPPPKLRYGTSSRQPNVTPRDGAWNMRDKNFVQSATIKRWVVIVFESRFNLQMAQQKATDFIRGCQDVGIVVEERDPIIEHLNGQGNITEQIRQTGAKCATKHRGAGGPDLLLVILPDGANDLYRAVKHFGDIQMGVATQCLKASKCTRASSQYWANVALKVNPKLGGVNVIPDQASARSLVDPANPAIIMGADVMHPAPGSDTPSFTAVVGNVDTNTARYVATSRVQASRQEIIEDLQDMAREILTNYMSYRKAMEKLSDAAAVPKRLIFLRDGVSEGQYRQVMEEEMEALKRACRDLRISPRITFVIVAKRHHWRLFPRDPSQGDNRSGNLPAGTVADRGITHPLEFDFYLLSHGGLLGTSRPSHYHVLYDDNNFSADSLQAFAYTLCHVYARATRSVSIPAPVYYADIVCSRAKNHFDPSGATQLSETGSVASGGGSTTLQGYKDAFKPIHQKQSRLMYFM